ncbi:MAG: DUF2961 domain-containing protein [Bacteroidota bacterium]|nr:DUF2961 domain-containing protein [Bacteroidota bacterium]
MKIIFSLGISLIMLQTCFAQPVHKVITLNSLLEEMSLDGQPARFPDPFYTALQASSYNRVSISPDTEDWFANGDGHGYIREEMINGKKAYVIMEQEGPGCITRMWTPFFYQSLENHTGPSISIYIDGAKDPVLSENFIGLLTGRSFVKPPFAGVTARAGTFYLPIPFAKRCKITLDQPPFYYCVNYRSYPSGTVVQSFSRKVFETAQVSLRRAAVALTDQAEDRGKLISYFSGKIKAGDSAVFTLPSGTRAIDRLQFQIRTPVSAGMLRHILLKISFDDQETVWCPLGDFFCSGDTLNCFRTKYLNVSGNMLTSRWVMPYRETARISLVNESHQDLDIASGAALRSWNWDDRSMYFHAGWCDYGYLPGDKLRDLNFIHINGKGILAGDALMVLSPSIGWWGEGDEKIYIDKKDIRRRFPSHFGTGTEDYYGWAGGEVPTGKDTFSMPFGANVRNGNPVNPRGYNICTRNRILDVIPFTETLKFDMEASPNYGTHHYDLLTYAMTTYWYGEPGAVSNRKADLRNLKQDLMSLPQIDILEREIKKGNIMLNADHLDSCIRALTAAPGS